MVAIDVLILANIHDFPTDRICLELNRAGVKYARLNSETLSEAKLTLFPQEPRLEITVGDQHWSVDSQLKSAWWRQPTFLRNTPHEALSLDEQLMRSQWPAFMRGLMLFDEAKWINGPAETYRAESKPWQLRQAAKLGFITPATMITNDPDAVVATTLGTDVAVKSIDTVLLREAGRQYFAYTQLVDWAECATPDLKSAPILVQEFLSPKLDLRVTVLGKHVWTVAIYADDNEIHGDWRLKKKSQLSYLPFELPSDVEQMCIDLVEKMHLTYGAIDLVVRNGAYIFIEINPTGEWGWLDSSERPIASAIASELATQW